MGWFERKLIVVSVVVGFRNMSMSRSIEKEYYLLKNFVEILSLACK